MTDPADWRPENEPEPEDERRPGDAVIVIIMAVIIAWMIGYGALYYAGVITDARTPAQYEGGGDDWDAPFWNNDEPTEDNDR